MGRMIQNNFSGGCLSPSLFGRSDLQAYYKGCASAENFIVSKEGTLRKRHGIESKCQLPVSFDNCRIVPYQYDRTQAGFVLLSVSGNVLTARLYDKSCTLKDTAIAANFSGNVKDIQAKQIGDQLWVSNGSFFKVITVTNFSTISITDWTQAEKPSAPSFNCTGYDENGNPYDGPGEIEIFYCAYVVTDGVNSNIVKRSAYQKKSWVAGAYVICIVTISAETRNSMDYVVIGKSHGGPSSYGELTRYYPEDFGTGTSLTFVDKNISPGDAIYSQTNILGKGFSNPVCVDCFQQRKVFANAANFGEIEMTIPSAATAYTPTDGITQLISATYGSVDYTDQCTVSGGTITFPSARRYNIKYLNASEDKLPMTMWFSEVGNLDNFYADRPAADDDPFTPTISSTGPSFIRWIVTYQEMMVLFTDSGLFSVGFSQTQGFSGSTCRISRFSNLAASPTIQPVVTDAGIVFVGADNKTIYTASYDLQENMIKPINRTVLVEHLTRTAQVKALALQSSPDNVVWVVLENGRYATFTFERNEEVYAWSDGVIEGARILDVIAPGSVTDTTSAATSSERTYGDLVFVVEKNGTQYLCVNSPGWADSIGGTAQNVKATLETLRPESQERTIVGYRKNVKDLLLRVYNTGGLAVKPTTGGEVIPLVSAGIAGGLFTGDVKVMPRGCINENGQMTFVSDNSQQCEILQIVTTIEVDG